MRALITGCSGFTGRYLADELAANGHQVHGLQSDLTDLDSLRAEVHAVRPEWVAHLAGIAFVAHGDPNDFYRVNLIGTRNLLQALADCPGKPKSVLLASSANVYGGDAQGTLTEDAPARPSNDYAVSKLAMEYMARLWVGKLPITIVRPFNYTGVGQSEDFVLPKIVNHFRKRAKLIELGNLDVSRDFSDVRSVVNAYRRLLEAAPAGETINICSGRACSLSDILATVGKIAQHEIEVRVNPRFVRSNEVKTLCGSPARLRALIGSWSSEPIEETLRWMLQA